jgi:phage gp29-like protein
MQSETPSRPGLLARIGRFFSSAPAPVVANYLPETKPEPKPAPSTVEIVTTPSTLDFSDSWAGYKLTPDRLAWVLRLADWGAPSQMYDAFESVVLSDGHTRGLYENGLDAVSVPWTWRAADARPGSMQLAADLAAITAELDIESAIEHLALQTYFGSAYVEVAWVTRGDGLQVPSEIVCVPHRRFIFDDRSCPRLTSEANPYPGDALDRRPGSSWIKGETRRWRRQVQAGLLRTVAWWCVFKRMSVRDWMVFVEKFGIPMIVGKIGENDSEATRKALKAAIASLGTEGQAILGGDASIDILTQALRSGGGDHLHSGITNLANAEISKCLTGGTLTSDTGGPGSFALGEVHAAKEHNFHLARARRIGTWIRRDLAGEYLARNRARYAAASAPGFHLHVKKLSQKEDSEVVVNLTSAGMVLSKGQIREQFELREPSGPDDELKPPTPPKPAAPGDKPNENSSNPPSK